jgi:long-subunit acyl-CoA synthetase (AMP-forming)
MTRYEWVAADLGILTAGGAVTTVYAQTEPDDVAYILNDSETKFVFAENEEQLTKLRNRKHQIPNVKKVIVFEGRGDGDWVISLDELEEILITSDVGVETTLKIIDRIEQRVAREKVLNTSELNQVLPEFLSNKNEIQVLEIFTDAKQNPQDLDYFFNYLR